MTVRPDSPHRVTFGGRTYLFCGAGCRAKFEADPQRYLSSIETAAKPAPIADAIYTCPMHPDIRQPRSGSCPKCGMALEPEFPPVATKTEWTCPMHPQIV